MVKSMARKKNMWWDHSEFVALLAETRNPELSKKKVDRIWEDLMNRFFVPLTRRMIGRWGHLGRVDEWCIAAELWKSARYYDLNRKTSSYSFFLVCAGHALGKQVSAVSNWAEASAFQRVTHRKDEPAPIPEGWIEIGAVSGQSAGWKVTYIAPYNHRVDPNLDTEVVNDELYFSGLLDDFREQKDLVIFEEKPELNLEWDVDPEKGHITVKELSDLPIEALMEAAGDQEWLFNCAHHYWMMLRSSLAIDRPNRGAWPPSWPLFEQSVCLFFGYGLNMSEDKPLIQATIARALKIARTRNVNDG